MSANGLDSRGVGQAPSKARYNDAIDARRKAEAADAQRARQAQALNYGNNRTSEAGMNKMLSDAAKVRSAEAYKELGKTKHIPMSKEELSNKANNYITRISTGASKDPKSSLEFAISASERAIVFGSSQAIGFLSQNAPEGRSIGYKAPADEGVATQINWYSVQTQFTQLQNGNIKVTNLQTSHDKNDRVAAWVYSMQHKFTDTHKLTAKEEAICKQFYLDAVNNGNFNIDYFAPGGSCCVLM